MAEYDESKNFFVGKKVPVDAEVNIEALTPAAKRLFTGQEGSGKREWTNMVAEVKAEGGPAVRIHRGARAN